MEGVSMYDSLESPEPRKTEYELVVSCEGEVVYEGRFSSEESLQEEGLRKAEHAVDAYYDMLEAEQELMLNEQDLEEDYV